MPAGIGAPSLPPDAGRVEGVLGRKLARQQLAEAVLPHLRREGEARRARNREYMRGIKATPRTTTTAAAAGGPPPTSNIAAAVAAAAAAPAR